MSLDVLTLDKTYQLHSWVSYEDAIMLEAKSLVLDHLGDDIVVYHGGTNKNGIESALATSSIIVVDGLPSVKRKFSVPALTNLALFQRDRYICAYCAGLFHINDLTRDHIQPVSKGGEDKWTNTVTACKSCNNLKDATLPGEKLGNGQYGPQGTGKMDLLYVPYIPCKAEALIMKNKHVKADQMAFLLDRIANKDRSRIYRDYKQKLLDGIC